MIFDALFGVFLAFFSVLVARLVLRGYDLLAELRLKKKPTPTVKSAEIAKERLYLVTTRDRIVMRDPRILWAGVE